MLHPWALVAALPPRLKAAEPHPSCPRSGWGRTAGRFKRRWARLDTNDADGPRLPWWADSELSVSAGLLRVFHAGFPFRSQGFAARACRFLVLGPQRKYVMCGMDGSMAALPCDGGVYDMYCLYVRAIRICQGRPIQMHGAAASCKLPDGTHQGSASLLAVPAPYVLCVHTYIYTASL
ncbi:hypothetical protein B0T26DRAFT_381644 [Lasiosphaeria miniovina]|uniref:Uncharacterized protein n=1 Tax=Lasiosphaeria miniovina TaxID=1954250 RepID=A0AA40ADR2_9PEZI|nr:uncharacterized protein B0T26DRAFT_381644 [Lasiosphaeria miniovina]KAK0713971.1 hypothetical protein B0T26DRAFT_381644 [Lasiosphaeria miniovina]